MGDISEEHEDRFGEVCDGCGQPFVDCCCDPMWADQDDDELWEEANE